MVQKVKVQRKQSFAQWTEMNALNDDWLSYSATSLNTTNLFLAHMWCWQCDWPAGLLSWKTLMLWDWQYESCRSWSQRWSSGRSARYQDMRIYGWSVYRFGMAARIEPATGLIDLNRTYRWPLLYIRRKWHERDLCVLQFMKKIESSCFISSQTLISKSKEISSHMKPAFSANTLSDTCSMSSLFLK